MLPKSIEAGRLLGPPMSVASLLMLIAPIIVLHGGAILTLLNHRSGAQGVPMWGRAAPPPYRLACETHGSVSPSYVSFPPPPRMYLCRSSSLFDLRAHIAPSAYISSPVTPSLEQSLKP
jgi:hypothetical protein